MVIVNYLWTIKYSVSDHSWQRDTSGLLCIWCVSQVTHIPIFFHFIAFPVFLTEYLCRLRTIWVKVAMATRPPGFLASCSARSHVTGWPLEGRSPQEFTRPYRSASRSPIVHAHARTRTHTHAHTHTVVFTTLPSIQRWWVGVWLNRESELNPRVGEWVSLTGGAEGQGAQGWTQALHRSVLEAQPLQTLDHQLAQRRRQALHTVLHLGTTAQDDDDDDDEWMMMIMTTNKIR